MYCRSAIVPCRFCLSCLLEKDLSSLLFRDLRCVWSNFCRLLVNCYAFGGFFQHELVFALCSDYFIMIYDTTMKPNNESLTVNTRASRKDTLMSTMCVTSSTGLLYSNDPRILLCCRGHFAIREHSQEVVLSNSASNQIYDAC
jgi:hypothetical protein